MDAKLKKVSITPAKFDDEGAIKADEFATVTIDVPMDKEQTALYCTTQNHYGLMRVVRC